MGNGSAGPFFYLGFLSMGFFCEMGGQPWFCWLLGLFYGGNCDIVSTLELFVGCVLRTQVLGGILFEF